MYFFLPPTKVLRVIILTLNNQRRGVVDGRPPFFDDGRIRFNQLANEINDVIGGEKVWPSVVIARLASIDVDPIGRRFLVPSADSVSGCGSLSDFGLRPGASSRAAEMDGGAKGRPAPVSQSQEDTRI
jgi:hypothetical protein